MFFLEWHFIDRCDLKGSTFVRHPISARPVIILINIVHSQWLCLRLQYKCLKTKLESEASNRACSKLELLPDHMSRVQGLLKAKLNWMLLAHFRARALDLKVSLFQTTRAQTRKLNHWRAFESEIELNVVWSPFEPSLTMNLITVLEEHFFSQISPQEFKNSIWRLGISPWHKPRLRLPKNARAINLFHVSTRPLASCASLSLPVKSDALLTVLLKSHVITTFRSILDFATGSKSFVKLILVSVILFLV